MHTRLHTLTYGIRVYNSSMYHIINSKRFNESDRAKLRLQIIEYHSKYGTRPTIDAFKISKSSIFRWKKMYLKSGKNIFSLIPKTTKPIHSRNSLLPLEIFTFIREYRGIHPTTGKEKIKPELDEFCMYHHLECISISSIGRILKRLNLTSPSNKVYHDPNRKNSKRNYKDRVKHSPKVSTYGYVQIDTIQRLIDGIKYYIFHAKDIYLRFDFSYTYTKNSTKQSIDFFNKLKIVYPLHNGIHTVQTDNGSEYLGDFHTYLISNGFKHKYIYPRCPRINGYVERANRSLQEEFVNHNEYLIVTNGLDEFNRRMMDYLVWFNTKRKHHALGMSPIQFMLKCYPQSHMYWTYTEPCVLNEVLLN